MLKYAHNSVDIGDHRYTNLQKCIFLKYKCDKKIAPPAHPKNVPTALYLYHNTIRNGCS